MTSGLTENAATSSTPGRVFTSSRRVRLGDVSPGGRLRLDAILRYLQDVGDDDTIDAGLVDAVGWVVRRTVLSVTRFPIYQELLAIATWCSGLGGRWAERSTSLVGEHGGLVDSATIWVHVDPQTLRAIPLPASFARIYGPSAAGRKVSAKLSHGGVPVGAMSIDWALRFADYDVMGHVNNAVVAELVEEQLSRLRLLRAPMTATFEYRAEVPPMASVRATVLDRVAVADRGGCGLWLSDAEGKILASADVSNNAPTSHDVQT